MRNAITFAVCYLVLSGIAVGQTAIPIPDTLSGSSIVLTMHKDSVPFFQGNYTQTLSYNEYSYLGPTIILNKGSDVSLTVNNEIGDTTNVHWHGLHVSPTNDGGPHTMIMDGMSWNPQFTVLNEASTYWYHPHFHGKTAEHAIKGAVGMLIVRDSVEATLNLPRTYGVDDFPLIIQSAELDIDNQFMPFGMEDSIILVNGIRSNYGFSSYLAVPAQVVRLRLLNASGERTFNFGLSNGGAFKIIGSDGGLLTAPINATRIKVTPGERYETLVDFTGQQGQNISLVSYGSELPIGTQGGPTMQMPPGSPLMDSPLNGIDFQLMNFNVTAQTQNAVLTIPSTLVQFETISASESEISRTIEMTAIDEMAMDGPFFFNEQSFDMERIDFYIPLDQVETWQLVNSTMVAHPFHIHDVQFFVLERNGNPPPSFERGRKDVVLVAPNETVKFITKFETFTDTVTPYVFHCHILMHEDDGMMGQFMVVPEDFLKVDDNIKIVNSAIAYPNPTNGIISLDISDSENLDLRVLDATGKVVMIKNNIPGKSIDVSALPTGSYQLLIRSEGQYYHSKIIRL